jgi:hypothetical protein
MLSVNPITRQSPVTTGAASMPHSSSSAGVSMAAQPQLESGMR